MGAYRDRIEAGHKHLSAQAVMQAKNVRSRQRNLARRALRATHNTRGYKLNRWPLPDPPLKNL